MSQFSRRQPLQPGDVAGVALWSALVMAAAILVFFGTGLLTGKEMFFTNEAVAGTKSVGSDIWHFNYPIRHFYAEELRHFRLPFWCHLSSSGIPMFAEGQVGALYPLNLVLFSLCPLPIAFNLSILLHVLIAGVFASMFAYQLGAGRQGSLLSGVLFGFSGFIIVHLKHLNMLQTAAWSPMLLFLIDRCYTELAHRKRTIVLIAVVVAIMILPGHPQMAYYNLVIAAIFALYRCVAILTRRPRPQEPSRRLAASFITSIVFAVGLGLLLAAPQLWPTARLNSLGIRQGGVSFELASRYRFSLAHLITFLRPYHFGDPGSFAVPENTATGATSGTFYDVGRVGNYFWEITGYMGIPCLLLVGTALVLGLRSRHVTLTPTLVLLITSLALALGKQGGLAWLFHAVLPGFSFFRFFSRFLLYVDLTLAVLAGLGLAFLLEHVHKRRGLELLVTVAAILICFGDLYRVFAKHNPRIPTEAWAEAPASISRILKEEANRNEPYRMICADDKGHVFANAYHLAGGWHGNLDAYEAARTIVHPNLNMLFDVPALGKYFSSLVPGWLNSELPWSLYNVRYALAPYAGSDTTRLNDSPGFELLASFRGDRVFRTNEQFEIGLYENKGAYPRAFLVPRAVVHAGDASQLIRSSTFDPRREVILNRQPDNGSLGSANQLIGATVAFENYESQRVRLTTDAPERCWLFLSDTYYPEWKAYVDGIAVPVYRANHAGRAVQVPQGTHAIEFVYKARDFTAGLGLFALGLLLLATWLVLARLRRPPASDAPQIPDISPTPSMPT